MAYKCTFVVLYDIKKITHFIFYVNHYFYLCYIYRIKKVTAHTSISRLLFEGFRCKQNPFAKQMFYGFQMPM